MDRFDIMRARTAKPELGELWEHRLLALERDREAAWADLRATPVLAPTDGEEDRARATYQRIQRLDRSIAFLDRALLHLQDVERGTHFADRLPLGP